ncbi:hypothetical protein, partial [Proteiniborus sp.]|uniref:hypothetical protein n=1 Tax=Proteiniborus sp. TaxID=2079015 RepID=UPI003318492B
KDVNLLLMIVLPLTFIVSPYSHSFMVIVILVWINNNDLKLRDFLYLSVVDFFLCPRTAPHFRRKLLS